SSLYLLVYPTCLHSKRITRLLPLSRLVLDTGQQFLCILDDIAISLLGQEKLTVGREFLVPAVACHDGVEIGQAAILLGAQDAPQALRFLLAGPEGAGNLDGDVRVGQVDGEIG